jgi:glutamine cyclotransferase
MGMLKKIKIAFSLIILTVLASGGLLLFANYAANSIPSSSNITTHTYRIVATYPHDPSAFTEGLAFANGFLYEGTGLYGQSSLKVLRVDSVSSFSLSPKVGTSGIGFTSV